ncbi:cation channel sperm-associated auxiliary subunit gamma-like [Rhincodon typus]|uniref:cation channel sperm-associated auxiliary subunit gamma-like n=1 Tax=Rhincodon typus TaxID=259920 RepID=UPI0020305AEC|nr:cation channel sperm-associated auxiliary subunit gamma-like [Rhincodon typus]
MLKFPGLLFWPVCLAFKCEWHIRLIKFTDHNQFSETILQQTPSANLDFVFQNLSDQGIDPFERLEHYYAFPYFLKIDLACENEGMQPIVKIRFQQPVRSVYTMPELLEIAVIAAPVANDGSDCLAEICDVAWLVPLPYKNGSVVSEALITSNKISLQIPDKKLGISEDDNSEAVWLKMIGPRAQCILLNIDGYLNLKYTLEVGVDPNIKQFDIGHEVVEIGNLIPVPNPSSPLWYLSENSPVLILGGINDRKVVLLSTTEFDDFTILEVSIDSCWIGSLSCPQGVYSATVYDAIATESMLFIRQNQLMYYFKGNFTLLRHQDQGSALKTTYIHHLTQKLGLPDFNWAWVTRLPDASPTMDLTPRWSGDCLVLWAALDRFQNATLLLVEGIKTDYEATEYYLVYYYFGTASFTLHYKLPLNIPKEKQGFLLLLGTEDYTNIPMIPMGITLSHMNSMAYIWGNFLFTSYNLGVTWLAVPGVPSDSLIRYFIPSWNGDFAFMTNIEELWYGKDGFPHLTRLRPSKGWVAFMEVQYVRGKASYYKSETTLSVFFDRRQKLQEIVYAAVPNGTTKIFKRAIPVEELLSYQEFFNLPYNTENSLGNGISFLDNCPFGVMAIKTLAPPLFYNRIQHYIAKPPWIFSETGLYNDLSLTVYQGLVHGLLWLHSTYYRPYADPVHDPTWRWWKNSRTAQHYYFYLASNKLSKGGFYVEAYDYRKHYDANIHDSLPSVIYLDKSSSYEFIVYLTMNDGKPGVEYDINQVWMSAHVSSPEYILVKLERKEIVNRGSLIYKGKHLSISTLSGSLQSMEVTVKDREYYAEQSLSGENLVVLSVTIKKRVMIPFFMNLHMFPVRDIQQYNSSRSLPIKSLELNTTPPISCRSWEFYSFQRTRGPWSAHPEITAGPASPTYYHLRPLFHCTVTTEAFYPFFLIQDMVTGKSDRFWGKYTFKVIGGGPYSTSNIRMFNEDEILMYNSLNHRDSLELIPKNSGISIEIEEAHIHLEAQDQHKPPTDLEEHPNMEFAAKDGLMKWQDFKYAAIWDIVDVKSSEIMSTEDGYRIFSGDNFGIRWICQKNSPCSDVPADGLKGPEYFLAIEVSNRGIDTSTYCDYRLEFLIHLHGLPLNPYRGLIFMLTTLSILWFILFSFIILRCYLNWFEKRLKLLSAVDPMVLPARTGDPDALDMHSANDMQHSPSSSSTSLHSSSSMIHSRHHGSIRNPNVFLKPH